MKHFLPILLLVLLYGCGSKPEAVIEGTVSGLSDGAKIYLADSNREKLDSTTVTGGTFRFDVKKAYPDVVFLLFDGRPNSF